MIIIGTNPATPMRDQFDSFEQYWNGLTKTPELFDSKYKKEHNGKTSKSTKNANQLLSQLEPFNVLVTNVVWYPVQRKKLIPKQEWAYGEHALADLILHIKPKVIFCHGADAESFIKKYYGFVDRYQSAVKQNVVIDGILILAYHHFSGQGLRKGSNFQPKSEFPVFSEKIYTHIRGEKKIIDRK